MTYGLIGLATAVALAQLPPPAVPGEGPPLNHAIGYYDASLARVVIVGGAEPPKAGDVDRAWSWSGARWEAMAGDGPPSRGNAAGAFDVARARAVVVGGARRAADGAFETLGDTWERRAGAWMAAPGGALGPRDHHAIVYDETRETMLLYGGTGVRGEVWPTDTWAYRPEGWSRVAADGPIGRGRAALAYDSARRQVVMFGGIGDGPRRQQPFFNDTWVWDGASWTQVPGDAPPARYAHGMAYDAARGVVLIYGGHDANGPLTDMWQWDGARWSEIALTGPTPGARYQPVMVYDAARGVTVLYGDLAALNRDTWEWNGSRWARK